MIINFNNLDNRVTQLYDICIVGSGAASLAMASQLFDTKIQVLILEAGGEIITDKDQKIYETINKLHPFPGSMDGRFRVFGGSTTKWGAQSLPLEKSDFNVREWIPNSGWPILYDEVAKYYPKVDEFLNLNPLSYHSDIFNLTKKAPLKADSKLTLNFSKWSPQPNIRENFRKKLSSSSNITLIQNANVKSINLAEDLKSVKSLTTVNFEGKEINFLAKKFVLACGGIENARILLASNKQSIKGIGNNNDLVGRYLQDHPNAHIATLYPNNKSAQHYFNYFYKKGTRFLPRFIFSKEFIEENKILNSSAYFSFISATDDSFTLAKELYRKYRRGNLNRHDLVPFIKIFKNIPDLFKISYQYFFYKRIYTPNALIKLNLMTESTPNKENRVTLSDEKDELGMPKAIISWEGDDILQKTFKRCSDFIKQYFDENNLGDLVLDNWVNERDWYSHIKDAKHHIGTTRMGRSDQDGVVDSNCKVFNIDNLFIAGSSVFPTSGHSNPTTTIIALSFRLVNHLKNI